MYEGRTHAPSVLTSHMSDKTRLPDLPLHSESDLAMLALKTDVENTDLALVQLEKSRIAGTFCTDVKSAQHQCGGVKATVKPVVASRGCVPRARRGAGERTSSSAAAAAFLHSWGLPPACSQLCPAGLLPAPPKLN